MALRWGLAKKELLLLGWSLRMAEMAELFKFQPHWPHWTKIALVCRFKAMSPPSHSVEMFGVGLHQKWSPCPRNYSSLEGAEESEYVQIG